MSYIYPSECFKWPLEILYFLGEEKIVSFTFFVSLHVFKNYFLIIFLNPLSLIYHTWKLNLIRMVENFSKTSLPTLISDMTIINKNKGEDKLLLLSKLYKIENHFKRKQKHNKSLQYSDYICRPTTHSKEGLLVFISIWSTVFSCLFLPSEVLHIWNWSPSNHIISSRWNHRMFWHL